MYVQNKGFPSDLVNLAVGAAVLKPRGLPFITTFPFARTSTGLSAVPIELIAVSSIWISSTLRAIGWRRVPLSISADIHRWIHGLARSLLLARSRRLRRRRDDGLAFLFLARRRGDNGLATLLRRRLLKARRSRRRRGHHIIKVVVEATVKVVIEATVKVLLALLLISLLASFALAAVQIVEDLVKGLPLLADFALATTRLLRSLLLRTSTATFKWSRSTKVIESIICLLANVTESNRLLGHLSLSLGLRLGLRLLHSAVWVLIRLLLVRHGIGVVGDSHILVLATNINARRSASTTSASTTTTIARPTVFVPGSILLLRLGGLNVHNLLLLVSNLPFESHDVPPGILVQPPNAKFLVPLHPIQIGIDGILIVAAALLLESAEEGLVLVLQLIDGIVRIDAEALLAGLDLAFEEADFGLWKS